MYILKEYLPNIESVYKNLQAKIRIIR